MFVVIVPKRELIFSISISTAPDEQDISILHLDFTLNSRKMNNYGRLLATMVSVPIMREATNAQGASSDRV